MLIKLYAGTTPALRLAAKALCTLGLVAQVAGCSADSDRAEANKKLELANQRIAALEAQLARVQAAAPVAKEAPVAASVTPAAAAAAAAAAPTSIEQPVSATGQQWSYNASEEKMTGGKRRTASVESKNTVDFNFPYSGSQNGHLTLRTDPQHGKDVLFRIEKGQILCPSYDGCTVQVRFDDEKPSNFAASGAADHSSNVVFLGDYNRFLSKLRKAKRVRFAVNIYQQGTPVFEFDVSGFDFDKYQDKS